MKKIICLFLPLIIPAFFSCRREINCDRLTNRLETEFKKGDFSKLPALCDSINKYCQGDFNKTRKADSLLEISRRIKIDFPLSHKDIISRLEKAAIVYNDDSLSKWEDSNWLECRIIDGEKKYFNRAVSNLKLLKIFYLYKADNGKTIREDSDMIARRNHVTEVIHDSKGSPSVVVPVDMQIKYIITVKPDAVPDGENIRCWLPWPRENNIRQNEVTLINTSEKDFVIAPDTCIHRSVYMEKKAEKDQPVIFSISLSYRSYAQYFNLDNYKIIPYDKNSELYKKYTSEQLPQICFTRGIRLLADSITEPGDSPAEIVKKTYMWFKENIPWTGALEYSIMPDIPEYVRTNHRGDCGMQTLLFMSLLRCKGIPVRWQSGWMVPPHNENLHDWCEVYYEGAGWIPADVSYDLQVSDKPDVRNFYLSGLDSYRLIINDGIGGPFYPKKKFMRSDPYDFQRGEVEWNGGNLYFDKWNYHIEIIYK